LHRDQQQGLQQSFPQLLPQPFPHPHPQPQLFPQVEPLFPQQQQIRTMITISQMQEQLLELLNHIVLSPHLVFYRPSYA